MTDPSIQELLRELVLKLCPSLMLAGVHRYTVARDNGDGRFDLNPRTGLLHPPRLRVEQWAAPGIEGGLVVGQEVAVVFLDNDEALPAILGHLPLRRRKPGSLKIDATGVITIGEHATAINIGGPAASALAFASLITTNFTALSSAITGVVIVPGDGGAAIKTAIVTLLGAGWPISMATTKAKGV